MKDPQEMEMPVPCANCNEWCELNDTRRCEGHCETLICPECYRENNGVCESCWEDEEGEVID